MGTDVSKWAVRGLYLLAVILVVFPLVDLFTAIWPFRATEFAWRHAALGLAASYLHTPVLGLAVGMALLYWQDRGRALMAVGLAAFVLALVLLPAMGVFGLDLGVVREMRPPEQRTATMVAGIIQLSKYAAASLAGIALGLGAIGTGKRMASGAKRRPNHSPGDLRRGK